MEGPANSKLKVNCGSNKKAEPISPKCRKSSEPMFEISPLLTSSKVEV